MEHGIDAFRLTPDTMDRFLISLVKIHGFLEKSRLCETILQITIKYLCTVHFQFFPVRLPTVFPCIKCIKKYTTDKTNLSLTVSFTVTYLQMYSGIINQRLIIDQTIYKKATKHLLHIRYRI